MTNRCLFVVGSIVACVALVPAVAAAQSVEPLRTAWGDPDLQGIWNNSTLTPFQRPAELGEQEFLSEEEAARIEQEAADRDARLAGRPALRTAAGASVDRGIDGAPGAYNNFWMERGTTVLPTRRTSVITDPPNGRLPAVTPELAAWMASPEAEHLAAVRGGRRPTDTWEQLDGGDRCLWYRGIPSFPTAYNNHYQIVQTPDVVAILQEHIHDVRFIPIDDRPHIDTGIRQFAGDSRGRWEGDTLVVETTHFNRHAFIRNFSPNLSEELHVVERFTRLGPDTLGYEFTVSDPETWTHPWSGSLPMARSEGPVYEYACHEGNYGLFNMLAGSRAQERPAVEGAR